MSYKFYSDIPASSISWKDTRSVKDIKYIVVHYTGNQFDTARNNALFFRDVNKRKAGAHLFVDETSVYQSIAPHKIAYSVGGAKLPTCVISGGGKLHGKCTNANSISVELCSQYGAFSAKTLDNAEECIKNLMKKYNISSSRVVRHFDVTGKQCPGWSGWYGKDSSKWYEFKKRFL